MSKKINTEILHEMRMALITSQVVLEAQVREYEAQNLRFMASLTNSRLREINQALEKSRNIIVQVEELNAEAK